MGGTTVNVAISMMSIKYEIASIVTLPRKDILIQSLSAATRDYLSCIPAIKIVEKANAILKGVHP